MALTQSFYKERLTTLKIRLAGLVISRNKALDKYKTKAALRIQQEINATDRLIQKVKLVSLFARNG